MRVCPHLGTEWSLIGSIGGILFDLPLLVLTNTQEGIGRKSISIGTGIFVSVSGSLSFW
jgi:hypothetical protein